MRRETPTSGRTVVQLSWIDALSYDEQEDRAPGHHVFFTKSSLKLGIRSLKKKKSKNLTHKTSSVL